MAENLRVVIPTHVALPECGRFASRKHAVLLSPVLPVWDAGAYFAPLSEILLTQGYSVTIYDTLSLVPELNLDLEELASLWATFLQSVGPIDLLAGAAMGGSVVQTALHHPFAEAVQDVVLISSPSTCDGRLARSLQSLVDLAVEHGPADALDRLAYLVRAEGSSEVVATREAFAGTEGESVVHRLKRGFEILMNVNAGDAVAAFPGRLVHFYGEQSRLVRRDHIVLGPDSRHVAIGIPQCGMRPITDGIATVRSVLADHFAAASAA